MASINYARIQLKDMLKVYSLKIAPPGQSFTLASGAKSSFYFDVRKTVQRGDAMNFVGVVLREEYRLLQEERARKDNHPGQYSSDAVAGVVLGGCHLATLLALRSSDQFSHPLNVIYVRKEAKEHGTGLLVEAPAMSGSYSHVILVEDVFTTGGSAKKAMSALRQEGLFVDGLITVMDRRPKEQRTAVFEGVLHRSAYTLEDFGLVSL